MDADELPDLSELTTLDERLREVAVDRGAVEAAALRAEELLAGAGAGDASGLLGYLGEAYGALDRGDEAVERLERSVALADDDRSRAVARIRLAEAHRCAGRPVPAAELLREALRETELPELHDLRDLALHRLGVTLLDAGRPDEAEPCLREALALRLVKRNPALVAATQTALARLRRR